MITGEEDNDIKIVANATGQRTVFIKTGEQFAGRVYEISIDISGEYMYCKNKNPFHPNIESGYFNGRFQCSPLGLRISKSDLGTNMETRHGRASEHTIIALKYLIQNPQFASPWDIDALVMFRLHPAKFTAKHNDLLLQDSDTTPFGVASYAIVKTE